MAHRLACVPRHVFWMPAACVILACASWAAQSRALNFNNYLAEGYRQMGGAA
jgi:hypothetical protein